MTFKTLVTDVTHFFSRPATAAKINEIKTAIHHDYDIVLAKAEAALFTGEARVSKIAHDELAAIRNASASALRRIEGLMGTGVLNGDKGEVAQVIAKALDDAANCLVPAAK